MNNLDSYPPILRQQNNQQQNPYEPNDTIEDSDPIPTIDLKCLEHKNLDEACKEWGLFRLINHGVPITLLEQLQDLTKQLFSLSFESKQEACNESPIKYFWGTPALTPSGTAITKGPQNINWVEGFDVPLCQLSNFQHQLPSLESIRLLLMEYATHLLRIATTLFEAMVKNLELNLKTTKPYLSENNGNIRVYRYPPTDVGWGMEVHTDSSVLSILNPDDHVSGLQVLKDDQWLTVKPVSNTLVVTLGDMMQAISSDRYKSVSHRVKVEKDIERISLCYFVFPGEDVVIESNKYKPFTYNEFRAQVQQDIKTLGNKVGLSRFQKKQG
uniref:Fe2OG dioxygenase domain-containing protein n=1 Tax=Medicago truncatula TaxID=3880 RepID=I3T7T0_MEDTR|nr:unknown [Medicago truncatula]